MNTVKALVINVGLALLSWVSILFAYAASNVLVVALAAIVGPWFILILVLAVLINSLTGLFICGIWSGQQGGKWRFIALLTGFLLACACLATLVFITGEHAVISHVYRHYPVYQVKMLLTIPAMTVFACCVFLWRRRRAD